MRTAGTEFPPEVWLNVFQLMGAEATIQDWMAVEAVCRSWRAATREWFTEWLKGCQRGVASGLFEGTKAQIRLLMRHAEGGAAEHACRM